MKAFHGSVVLRNDGPDILSGKDDLNAGVAVPITVRKSSDLTLASLFDIDDLPLSNPFPTTNKGNYEFKVASDTYDIIIQETTPDEVKLQLVQIFDITKGLILSSYFGVVGDDTVDDLIAIQKWVDFVIDNNAKGFLEQGRHKITGPIIIKQSQDWSIFGAGFRGSTIIQYTDNTPIFKLGRDADNTVAFDITLSDFGFEYNSPVDQAHTDSNPIFFNKGFFHINIHNMHFNGGLYAIKIDPGIAAPWGGDWRSLTFGSGMVGGCIDSSGTASATPNNSWDLFFVDAVNMEQTYFKDIKGYNFTIGTLEIISASHGQELMTLQAGAECTIQALKLENGTYDAGGIALFGASTNAKIRINQFNISGPQMDFNPVSGQINIFDVSRGGDTGWFSVGTFTFAANTLTGNVFAIKGQVGEMNIDNYVEDGKGLQLTDTSTTATCERLTVGNYLNKHMTQNLGDVDTTVLLGDPNTAIYQTALTTTRTHLIPSLKNELFNGLQYKVVLND